MLDILYVSRVKNMLIGWNNGKKVYTRKFNSVNTAKIIVNWARAYLKMFGDIPQNKINMQIDYIVKHSQYWTNQ